MLLTIKERFLLGFILPKEGNLLTMKVVQGLHDLLGFDESEQLAVGMKQDEGNTTWDPNAKPQELEIGELSHGIIRDALNKLDDDKKITVELVPLHEKFVGAPKPPEE